MKTAISLPDNLFEAADDLAKKLGISRSLLYQRAIESYLRTRSHDVVRESLDEVYAGDQAGALDPAIEYMQGISVAEDDW